MGVWKINTHDISSLKMTPKELSMFWRAYFSNLSVSYSKMFFQILNKKNVVHFLSRDLIIGSDYFETVGSFSLIQPFTILPHGEVGFIHISDEFSNFLINFLQGGESQDPVLRHELTTTDKTLLNPIVNKMLTTLEEQFQSHQIEIHPLDEHNILLYANSFQSKQLLSTQIYSFEVNGNVFTFTIAMTNRMLEQFIGL